MSMNEKLAQLPTLLQYAGSSTGYMTNEALGELCYVQAAQIEALQRTVQRLMEDAGKGYKLYTLYGLHEPTGVHPEEYSRRLLTKPVIKAGRPIESRPNFDALVKKAFGITKLDGVSSVPESYVGLTAEDEMLDGIATFGESESEPQKKSDDEDPRDRKARLKHMVSARDYERKQREEKGSK